MANLSERAHATVRVMHAVYEMIAREKLDADARLACAIEVALWLCDLDRNKLRAAVEARLSVDERYVIVRRPVGDA
jgi:hypothetical protein